MPSWVCRKAQRNIFDITGECEILTLVLQPLHLALRGPEVDRNHVALDITSEPGLGARARDLPRPTRSTGPAYTPLSDEGKQIPRGLRGD